METVTPPIGPDDIDLEFVAKLSPDLETVTIGDEQVVIGEPMGVVVLNPTAALIFGFLDGEATLEELVDDFTDALDADRAVVESDVLGFVRHLGANGLLEGVALPAPEFPEGFEAFDTAWEEPEPLEVGTELDDFTLPDLAGEARSLSDFRGKRTLLVNWSPHCGYCVAVADELAALDPLLAEHDVSLVMLTLGDADTNRALNDAHGLRVPTLLRDGTDVDPFLGTGTPAAYLLDVDGTLAEAMVVGANQVPVLARDLAGVDPATPYGEPVLDDAGDDVDDVLEGDEVRGKYLPAPGAMCGAGGGAASSSTDWQGTRAYAFGEYHVGVRYDAPETAAVLDRLFPGARVHDRRVPDNYSVALGATPTTKGAGVSRSLKLLVHGSSQLVRSRSGGRVLAALLQQISADLGPADPSLVRVSATAVVRDGEALLLPAGLRDHVQVLQPRFAKAGMTMVDTPRVLLDFEARELVVPTPTVPFAAAVIDELDTGVKLGNELPWVRPGRVPLRAWFLVRGPNDVGPLSPALAVTAALSLCYDRDADLRVAVDRFADLFESIAPFGLWYETPDDLVDGVQTALT